MNATLHQPGILDAVPAVARYVNFVIPESGTTPEGIKDALTRLSPLANGSDVVLGIGPSLAKALGAEVPGLHEFPDFSGHGAKVPSTPGTLWCWIRGDDLGDLLHLTRKVQKALAPAFAVRHGKGPDQALASGSNRTLEVNGRARPGCPGSRDQ